MNKLFYTVGFMGIFSAIILICLVFYWLVCPYNVAKFSPVHPVYPKTVKAGGQIVLTVDFCKYTKHIPLVSRSFVDGVIYHVPEVYAIGNDTGCYTKNISVSVPKILPTGTYHINTIYKYQVNPIRTIDIKTVSEEFEVIE